MVTMDTMTTMMMIDMTMMTIDMTMMMIDMTTMMMGMKKKLLQELKDQILLRMIYYYHQIKDIKDVWHHYIVSKYIIIQYPNSNSNIIKSGSKSESKSESKSR
jgi:hypothetical protein